MAVVGRDLVPLAFSVLGEAVEPVLRRYPLSGGAAQEDRPCHPPSV